MFGSQLTKYSNPLTLRLAQGEQRLSFLLNVSVNIKIISIAISPVVNL